MKTPVNERPTWTLRGPAGRSAVIRLVEIGGRHPRSEFQYSVWCPKKGCVASGWRNTLEAAEATARVGFRL
jgi:hypothetical protein